jgi:hypothetical protein
MEAFAFVPLLTGKNEFELSELPNPAFVVFVVIAEGHCASGVPNTRAQQALSHKGALNGERDRDSSDDDWEITATVQRIKR